MDIDFHSTIQPQPSTTNVNWSDEDCDYIFETCYHRWIYNGPTENRDGHRYICHFCQKEESDLN